MSSQCFQNRTRAMACVFSAAFLFLCAASCSSSPSIQERAQAQSIEVNTPPLAAADTPAAKVEPAEKSDEPALKSKVYFNLTPVSLPPEDASPSAEAFAQETGAAKTRSDAPAQTAAPPSLSTVSDAALVAELKERLETEWAMLSGGLGETPESADGRRLSAARQILAMCFLRQDHGSDDEAVTEAIRAAHIEGAGDDLRLLAAACSAHAGRIDEAATILEGISFSVRDQHKDAGSEDAKPDEAKPEFQVTGLTFARSIDGPGKLTPADASDIAPGKQVLVYGELRNFRSVKIEKRGAEPDAYRRSFAASLRIVSSTGEEIDQLEFLPESRGRQTASAAAEVMNFWARYRIPADMKAGSYKLTVDAKDLLGAAEAAAEIDFELAAK